jgi:hypothetical protein
MIQIVAATIGMSAVIIILPFFIVYEREKRKELKRIVDRQTKTILHLENFSRNLENDFVLLETRFENLDEEVRELQQKQLNPES